jgi:PPP family 3-phenylpropionic acid transporter
MAKSFYFLIYAAWACLLPFLTLYYQDLDLSGREIGALTAIFPLVGMVGTTIWGMAADITGRHRALFLLAIGGTWVSVFLMTRVDTFLELVPIVIVYAFCFSPVMPFFDNSVLHHYGESGYGQQRVWGSYGWGLGGAVAGSIIAASGLTWAFIGFLALYLPLFLIGTRVPMTAYETRSNFWAELRILLSNRGWLFFLAVATIESLSLNVFLNYLFLYLGTLGTSTGIMGLTLTFATISEIPVFLYSRRLLARWSPAFLLGISMIFTVIRSFAYVNMTAPWQVLIISLLHGPTFAIMWIAGVAYANEIAPPGLGTTAQSVFSAVVMGFGSALGAFSGGLLYEATGPASVFYFAGYISLAATAVFIFANYRAFIKQLQPLRSQ